MVHWIFMTLMSLLIPATMLFFGKQFVKGAPKEINNIYGYRTAMSMKNRDTWEFAHKFNGKIWVKWGWIELVVTPIVMLAVLFRSEIVVYTIGLIVMFLQTFPILISIPLTERALRQTFNKNGTRK